MDPTRNMIGNYDDEVREQVETAKKSTSAKNSDDIVKNII